MESALPEPTLEQRLNQALAQVSGVGRVSCVVTYASGSRYAYLKDRREQEGQSEEETVILSGSDRGEQPVITQETYPECLGVLVVCQGGGDPVVQLKVIQAVTVLTGADSSQITVLKGDP